MRRRRALAALTALAASAALAQPQPRPLPQRIRRITVFFFGTPANSRVRRDAFYKGMQALGYVEGTHVREWRYDMPIEGPTRNELAVNRKAAAAIRLAIPASLTQKADRLVG